MIYILAGVAKSGKTLIAKQLVQEYQIPYFSTDYLMMSLSLSKKDTGVNHELDDAVVAKSLEPYLYPMIRAMVENGIDYLIEGVHFNPDFARKLLDDFPGKIHLVYLGYAQVDTFQKVNELLANQKDFENPWFKDWSQKQLEELVDYLKKVSKKIEDEAKSLQIPYIEVYNIITQSYEIKEILRK